MGSVTGTNGPRSRDRRLATAETLCQFASWIPRVLWDLTYLWVVSIMDRDARQTQ
ncbi:hypothetical protein GCM10009815_23750 [Nocardioides marmoribigeumensis]